MSITTRLTSLIATLSIASLAAACGDEDHTTAKFQTATDQQLNRAYMAGSGGDVGIAMIFASFAAGQNSPDACPKIVTSGDTTTLTGGCTSDDGTKIEGSITIENYAALTSETGSGEWTITYDGFKSGEGADGFSIDGSVTGETTADRERIDAEVTVRFGELGEATSSMQADCGKDDAECKPDFWISVDGFGNAESSFSSTTSNGVETRKVVLTGEDTITFTAVDEADCVDYQVEGGRSGQLCNAGE